MELAKKAIIRILKLLSVQMIPQGFFLNNIYDVFLQKFSFSRIIQKFRSSVLVP